MDERNGHVNFNDAFAKAIREFDEFQKQERDKGCEYCEKPAGRDLPRQDCANGDVGVREQIVNGSIFTFLHGLAAGYVDIKYCPICGRRLEEQKDG